MSGFEIDVPADFSSAAFFFGAAAITGCELNVMGPNLKDTQGDKDVVRILNDMGCEVENLNDKGVRIKGSKLTGISVDMESIPDALPILSVVGCFAEGETVLYNAAHTRTKETDRIAVMAQELKKMGADITERPDGLVIRKSDLTGAEVKSHDDHRVAMSLAVASLRASGKTTIEGCEAAAVTFPNFFELLESVKK